MVTYYVKYNQLEMTGNKKEVMSFLTNKNNAAYEIARWGLIHKAERVKLYYKSNLFELTIEEQ